MSSWPKNKDRQPGRMVPMHHSLIAVNQPAENATALPRVMEQARRFGGQDEEPLLLV